MATPATDLLRAEHRRIEHWLDALLRDLGEARAGALRPSFHEAHRLSAAHYAREQAVFLPALPPGFRSMASKMAGQHERVLELARHVAGLLEDSGAGADLARLAREFHAIAQHNIIEEERDFLPLVDRALDAAAQEELARRLAAAL
jgi:hypothetical protein